MNQAAEQELIVELSRHEHGAEQELIMELSRQASHSSAGTNHTAQQARVKELNRQVIRS